MANNPASMVQSLRNTFASGKPQPISYREQQLRSLLRMYKQEQSQIVAALEADLHKPRFECFAMEIEYLINDLINTLANLHEWTKPEKQPKAFANLLDDLYVHSDPLGVVLVIGSWNYPIQLTLLPVHGAIAAGNCVVIKPSEVSSHCSRFLAETVPKYLDSECYRVFEGGAAETSALLKQRFDYIFYTGSTKVGQLVHKAAAENLTPCTLELGGKSPVFLDSTADLLVSTKRILWGKFVNAGQTCVAPDYLLCTPETRDKFIKVARSVLIDFFGENPKKSPDFGRIITSKHLQRLESLLKDAEVVIGGEIDVSQQYLAPTIVNNAKLTDPLMLEEIFGPILPIVTVSDAYEAIKLINGREKPLTLYIFSNDRRVVDCFIKNTSSGGVCVNDTIMQMATEMPFGGVGQSGIGQYHGKHTFDTFSHKKSCLYKDLAILGEKLGWARYPPYTKAKLSYLKFMLAPKPGIPFGFVKYLLVFGVGYLVAVLSHKIQ